MSTTQPSMSSPEKRMSSTAARSRGRASGATVPSNSAVRIPASSTHWNYPPVPAADSRECQKLADTRTMLPLPRRRTLHRRVTRSSSLSNTEASGSSKIVSGLRKLGRRFGGRAGALADEQQRGADAGGDSLPPPTKQVRFQSPFFGHADYHQIEIARLFDHRFDRLIALHDAQLHRHGLRGI